MTEHVLAALERAHEAAHQAIDHLLRAQRLAPMGDEQIAHLLAQTRETATEIGFAIQDREQVRSDAEALADRADYHRRVA